MMDTFYDNPWGYTDGTPFIPTYPYKWESGGGDRSEEQKKVDKEQDEKLSIEIARSTETDALQDKKISDMEGKLDAASSYETDEGE